MRRDFVLTASCLIALVGSAAALAQDAVPTTLPQATPAPAPANDTVVEENDATIVTVTGKVQIGASRTGPWRDAKVGMQLKEGEWVRTGVNSLVNIRVGQEQIFSGTGIALISIDRMRKAVSDASQSRTDETDIRLEYGRLLFNVTSTAHANDVEIQAPDATLAIKGTSGGMEVISDRTSAAFGGEMNQGRFTVSYIDGSVASINDNSQSTSNTPDPARNGAKNSRTLTGAKYSREQDEETVVDRSPGGGDAVNALGNEGAGNAAPFTLDIDDDTPPPPPPPPPGLGNDLMFLIDPPALQLRGRNIDTGAESVLFGSLPRSAASNPDAGVFVEGGLGFRTAGSANQLLYLFGGTDDNGDFTIANELFALALPADSATPADGDDWVLLNSYANAPMITGIDTLGESIYGVTRSAGGSNFDSRLISLTTGANGSLTNLLDFHIPLDGAVAGANTRGTLFLASSNIFSNGFLGSANGEDIPSFFDSLILEVDPRNSYLANSWFGFANGVGDLSGTVFGPGVSPTANFNLSRFTGAAFVDGMLVLSAYANVDNDAALESIYVHMNPNVNIGSESPVITRIELANGQPIALAGVNSGPLAPSTSLIATSASVLETAGIDPLLGRIAFSQNAWNSGFVILLVIDAFTEIANDPAACLQDSAALTQLAINLFNNIDHQYGIANAIAQTHAMLMPGAVCNIDGMIIIDPIPQLSGLQGIDTIAGHALEITLAPPNTASIDNLPASHIDGGYAVRDAAGSAVELLYLDGGNAYSDGESSIIQYNNLYARTVSATAGNSSGFQLIANFNTGSGDGTPGAVLTGLAALNNTLYATRHEYNNLESALVRLNTANATLTTLAELPGASFQAAATAPDLGAIYLAGLYSTANPNPSARYNNLFLMSVDPRTTSASGQASPLILETFWGQNSDFALRSGTAQGSGFNIANFDQVERVNGLAYDGHFLQLGAFAGSDGIQGTDAFFITYHPDATNSQLDPHVTALDVSFSAGIAGLATAAEAASTGVTHSVIDPQDGHVDMVTINSFFARISYTPEALESGLLQDIFTQHFIATADDPVNCANSTVIGLIPGALSDNANKAHGIGRATYQLRNVLPQGHACGVATFMAENQ